MSTKLQISLIVVAAVVSYGAGISDFALAQLTAQESKEGSRAPTKKAGQETEQDKTAGQDKQGRRSERPDELQAEKNRSNPAAGAGDSSATQSAALGARPEKHTIKIPKSWKRLGKHEIWIDMKAGEVIAAGVVCLRHGPLEMFVCPLHTKEHESVIAVNALASEVHASLVALGADPGRSVRWHPEYKPATGPKVAVTVLWKEDGKMKKRRGQEMVRDFKTKKPMQHDWVFGGSEVYVDPTDGTKFYYGDAGELICVSNFSTATMDVPIRSSDANDFLMFEAFTENIPPVGTKVYVVMKPDVDRANKKAKPVDDKNAKKNSRDGDESTGLKTDSNSNSADKR